jgi:predicted ester cyclase
MSEENKELVRSYYEHVLNGRNLDAVGEYYSDERVIEGVRRGCFSYFQAFPDLYVSIDELIEEGDNVFCR